MYEKTSYVPTPEVRTILHSIGFIVRLLKFQLVENKAEHF